MTRGAVFPSSFSHSPGQSYQPHPLPTGSAEAEMTRAPPAGYLAHCSGRISLHHNTPHHFCFCSFEMNLVIYHRLLFNSQSSASAFPVLGLTGVHSPPYNPIPSRLQFSLTCIYCLSSTPSTALDTVEHVRDTKGRLAICNASN